MQLIFRTSISNAKESNSFSISPNLSHSVFLMAENAPFGLVVSEVQERMELIHRFLSGRGGSLRMIPWNSAAATMGFSEISSPITIFNLERKSQFL